MTSPSPLDRLAGPGYVLAKEAPDANEFAGLVHSGLARLKDAENDTNSLESSSISRTERRTRSVWRRCGITGIARRSATSCSRYCRTR